MSQIFVSYRRADSSKWANRLYGHLSMRYGKDLVFQDIDDINAGDDWAGTIRQEISSCQVFLVIIGPHWLDDAKGRRRLESLKAYFVLMNILVMLCVERTM
jgi:hypothetical protein